MSLRSGSKPKISGPSRPPAGRSNGLRTGSQKVSGPSKPPAGSKGGVRTKTSKPTIKTPVRSTVVISN